MALSNNSLWISDSSPLFFYSPAEAYFSGQNLNSWVGNDGSKAGFKQDDFNVTMGDTGTYHSASGGDFAVVLPSIYATSFTPLFTSSEEYNITFQIASWPPEPWASGKTWNTSLDDFNPQTFTMWFHCLNEQGGCGEIDFLGAWIDTKFAPDNSQIDTAELDDASPLIQYEGFAPIDANNKNVEVDSEVDYEETLSMTSTEGAKAKVSFKGASISIYGVTCPTCGTFTINLDDSGTYATLNSFNNATTHNSLLFFATNLDTSLTHSLTLESKGGVVIDRFEVKGPKGGVGFIGDSNGTTTTVGPSPNPTSTSGGNGSSGSGGNGTSDGNGNGNGNGNGTGNQNNLPASQSGTPNAGVIVGAILGTLAGLGFLYYLCRKVAPKFKKKEDKKLNPWDEANLLQNMKNEEVHVTTAANQRYVYPGLIAHSDLKKK